MKLRLTPLNLVSSAALVAGVLLFISKEPQRPQTLNVNGMLGWFGLLTAVIFFISDLIFRRFVPSLKKLWIIEGVLVVFMVILIFIIKSN